jgi:hypothetical protein
MKVQSKRTRLVFEAAIDEDRDVLDDSSCETEGESEKE